jgi:acyl-ACP thioesterase
MFHDVVDGEKTEMSRAARVSATDTPTHEGEHTVVYSDLDYNGHCNSCKYLEMMLNTRFPAFLRAARQAGRECPLRLDINYQKEVGEGEQMHICCFETEDDIRYIGKTREGAVSCTCRIAKMEKRPC